VTNEVRRTHTLHIDVQSASTASVLISVLRTLGKYRRTQGYRYILVIASVMYIITVSGNFDAGVGLGVRVDL
jgi:hypothetical protein